MACSVAAVVAEVAQWCMHCSLSHRHTRVRTRIRLDTYTHAHTQEISVHRRRGCVALAAHTTPRHGQDYARYQACRWDERAQRLDVNIVQQELVVPFESRLFAGGPDALGRPLVYAHGWWMFWRAWQAMLGQCMYLTEPTR